MLIDEELRPGGLALTKEMAELAALSPGAILLDVGCGFGTSVLALCEWGYAARGIDASPKLVQKGQAWGADIELGDATALTGSYDALLYECVLSALPDRAAALNAARDVLEDDGKLLVSDLYLREGEAFTLPGLTCLNGVLSWPKTRILLEHAGFSLLHFADKTPCLKEFTATLIMNGEAPALPSMHGVKLGYFISVWQKHACCIQKNTPYVSASLI